MNIAHVPSHWFMNRTPHTNSPHVSDAILFVEDVMCQLAIRYKLFTIIIIKPMAVEVV